MPAKHKGSKCTNDKAAQESSSSIRSMPYPEKSRLQGKWQKWYIHFRTGKSTNQLPFIDHTLSMDEMNAICLRIQMQITKNSPILTVTYKQGLLKERLKEAQSAETLEPDHQSLRPWEVCWCQAVSISHLKKWISNNQRKKWGQWLNHYVTMLIIWTYNRIILYILFLLHLQ